MSDLVRTFVSFGMHLMACTAVALATVILLQKTPGYLFYFGVLVGFAACILTLVNELLPSIEE